MERTLHIKIECGDKTCVDPVTNKRCSFLMLNGCWQVPLCTLFNETLSSDDQRYDGLTERCRQCLASESKET